MHMPWGRPGEELWSTSTTEELEVVRVMARARVVEGAFFDPPRRRATPAGGFLSDAQCRIAMAIGLNPCSSRSVAVARSTETRGTVGRAAVENLLKEASEGRCSRSSGSPVGVRVRCYPTLARAAEPVEHVIFAVRRCAPEAALVTSSRRVRGRQRSCRRSCSTTIANARCR